MDSLKRAGTVHWPRSSPVGSFRDRGLHSHTGSSVFQCLWMVLDDARQRHRSTFVTVEAWANMSKKRVSDTAIDCFPGTSNKLISIVDIIYKLMPPSPAISWEKPLLNCVVNTVNKSVLALFSAWRIINNNAIFTINRLHFGCEIISRLSIGYLGMEIDVEQNAKLLKWKLFNINGCKSCIPLDSPHDHREVE